MITRPASTTSWNLAFLAMLVLALTACGVQAVAILKFRDPKPSVTARSVGRSL